MDDRPCIVISDVHGCWYTLVRLLNRCPRGACLFLNGDLIDRGPHSRKVVEFAMKHSLPTVCGNHEDLCLAFYKRGSHCVSYYAPGVWLDNGGIKALQNWPSIDLRAGGWEAERDRQLKGRVPDAVLDWMAALPAYIIPDTTVDAAGRRLLISHTGYGLAADKDDWFLALWGRHAMGDEQFPEDQWFRPVGHTQVKEPVVTDQWAYIDTGAAYASRGYGHLTAFIWPTKEVITVPYDETPVEPSFKVVDKCIVD